jgi:hypothetical protein
MNEAIRKEYARMRKSGTGGIVGEDARRCLDYARARNWYEQNSEEVTIAWDYETDSYESVYGMPAYQDTYYACMVRVGDTVYASLGFVDKCDGDYARQVENELLLETMRGIDSALCSALDRD